MILQIWNHRSNKTEKQRIAARAGGARKICPSRQFPLSFTLPKLPKSCFEPRKPPHFLFLCTTRRLFFCTWTHPPTPPPTLMKISKFDTSNLGSKDRKTTYSTPRRRRAKILPFPLSFTLPKLPKPSFEARNLKIFGRCAAESYFFCSSLRFGPYFFYLYPDPSYHSHPHQGSSYTPWYQGNQKNSHLWPERRGSEMEDEELAGWESKGWAWVSQGSMNHLAFSHSPLAFCHINEFGWAEPKVEKKI